MRKKVIISLGVKGYFCDCLAKNGTALPTKPDDIWPAFSRAFKATHRLYVYVRNSKWYNERLCFCDWHAKVIRLRNAIETTLPR